MVLLLFQDECLPAGEVPEYLADVFGKCRSLAFRLHEVYPPGDDTLLMIEHGTEQLSQLLSRSAVELVRGAREAEPNFAVVNVLEVGSGSGMISAALLQQVLANCLPTESPGGRFAPFGSVHFYTTDKNPFAVQCTRESLPRS